MHDETSPQKLLEIADGRLQIALVPRDQEILITATSQTSAAIARFNKFVTAVVRQSPAFQALSSHEQLIACVVCFEISQFQDLQPVLKALESPFFVDDSCFVSWTTEEEMKRLKLSPLTVAARKRISDWEVNWELLIETFTRSTSQLYTFANAGRIESRLSSIFSDRHAWCFLNLPMPLLAHILGLTRMTLLPDSAWLRRFRIPLLEHKGAEVPLSAFEPIEESITEVLYGGESQLSGAWFSEELTAICSGLSGPGISLSNAAAWNELSRRLSALAAKLEMAGPIEALLLGWALDVAIFGTARKKSPRVKTLSNYLRSGVRPLHHSIRKSGQHPLSLTSESWNELFAEIEQSGQGDRTLRPALASFHRYLIRSIDADPIPRLFSIQAEVAKPKANVIWQHEFDAVASILDQLTADPRIRDQLPVWNALLRSSTLRFGELIGLQLKSIQDFDGSLEIQVAPHRGARPLKTASARRILPIHDHHASETIRNWLRRRKLEGASGEDFLFGDPVDSRRVYRLGACYRAYSSALKNATGDPTVTVHTTRHSFISNFSEDGLLQLRHDSQVNFLHRLSVLAGHAHERTTLMTYAHLIELPVRHWTDMAIQRHMVHHSDVSRWSGVSAAAIRQRFHRSKTRGWSPLAEVGKSIAPNAITNVESHLSSAPESARIRTRKISQFNHFVRVASDILNGFSHSAVSARNSVDQLAVDAVSAALTATTALSGLRRNGLAAYSSRFNFNRLARPTWAAMLRELEKPDARASCVHLFTALTGPGIDMATDSPALTPVLHIFKNCGFSALQFVLRFVPTGAASVSATPSMQYALRRFSAVFGSRPQVESVSSRRGRSSVYLLVLSGPAQPGHSAPPARTDIPSLRFIALCSVAFDHFLGAGDIDAN